MKFSQITNGEEIISDIPGKIEFRPVPAKGQPDVIDCYDIYVNTVWKGSRHTREACEQYCRNQGLIK